MRSQFANQPLPVRVRLPGQNKDVDRPNRSAEGIDEELNVRLTHGVMIVAMDVAEVGSVRNDLRIEQLPSGIRIRDRRQGAVDQRTGIADGVHDKIKVRRPNVGSELAEQPGPSSRILCFRSVDAIGFALEPEESAEPRNVAASNNLIDCGLQFSGADAGGVEEVLIVKTVRPGVSMPRGNFLPRSAIDHHGGIHKQAGGRKSVLYAMPKLVGADVVHSIPRPSGIGLSGCNEHIDHFTIRDGYGCGARSIECVRRRKGERVASVPAGIRGVSQIRRSAGKRSVGRLSNNRIGEFIVFSVGCRQRDGNRRGIAHRDGLIIRCRRLVGGRVHRPAKAVDEKLSVCLPNRIVVVVMEVLVLVNNDVLVEVRSDLGIKGNTPRIRISDPGQDLINFVSRLRNRIHNKRKLVADQPRSTQVG